METQFILELLQNYGYIGIFLFLVLGIAGLPLPDEIMMTFLGYLTSIRQLDFTWTYLSALLGSASGITISYILGLKLGYPFLKRYGKKIFITPRRLRISQLLFRKYGSGLLFIGYFIPGVRHVTAYLAGISKMSVTRFALFAYSGAIIWCATFIGLGHLLGANWELIFVFLHRYGAYGLLLLVPILIWFFWSKKNRKPLRNGR
ncbi:membrane protein DedA, SNARE-associated domain [Seinonella peptonophila]|uniref:Membrane protein DedA, SNARE-associated domain n=1 Tax=Seinonella peptonophila TaxID=112248 RepID=A0A1M4V5M6_9BACL|nr:DedA family protein [Seinonella peptonophila]SHE64229.1 membrane protein DedA, SNARE-associated domain [Seinonella peptonophila]